MAWFSSSPHIHVKGNGCWCSHLKTLQSKILCVLSTLKARGGRKIVHQLWEGKNERKRRGEGKRNEEEGGKEEGKEGGKERVKERWERQERREGGRQRWICLLLFVLSNPQAGGRAPSCSRGASLSQTFLEILLQIHSVVVLS